MIIVFHALCAITRYLFSFFAGRSVKESLRTKYAGSSEIDFEAGTKFFPPVYVQRYSAVRLVLEDERWRGKLHKVVDFGCAELSFFVYLKRLEGVNEVLEVDVDHDVLEGHQCKVAPLHADYLNPRKEPLKVYVYRGSIAYPDECLKGCDAVICIELIEHVYPDVLEAIPFTVFGFIKPLVAVFTTPNGEFNVLFKDLKGFRHHDHKFEWNREQFECWANNIVLRYPEYTVCFQDIGCDKAAEHLGGCSQMAVFERHTFVSSHPGSDTLVPEPAQKVLKEEDFDKKYYLLQLYEYPFRVDNRTEEEKIRDQAAYYIRLFQTCESFLEGSQAVIPLSCILPTCKDYTTSMPVLERILRPEWQLVEHKSGGLAVVVPEETSSEDSEAEEEENDFPFIETNDVHQQPIEEEIWSDEEEGVKWDTESWYTSDDVVCANKKEEQSVQEFEVSHQGFLEQDGECSFLSSSSSKNVSSSSVSNTHTPSLTTITEETSGQFLESRSIKHKTYLGDNCPPSCTVSCAILKGSESVRSMAEAGEKCKESEMPSDANERELSVVDLNKSNYCDTSVRSHSSPAVVKEDIDVSGADSPSLGPTENSSSLLNLFPTCPSPVPCPISSGSSGKLCLNLPECLVESGSETVGKPVASESPVVESSSLEEGNDRFADSGYPNSGSAQDMDLDLTPEQVDELFTEGDVFGDHHPDDQSDSVSVSSKDSDSINEEDLQPPPPPQNLPLQPDMLFEEAMNVENGDVANNNRDLEGNNAVAAAAMLHEGLPDLRPLLEAAEDLDNDNEIQIHMVEPFPLWLLNLLGLANGGGIGVAGDAPQLGLEAPQGLEEDDDDDSASDPVINEHLVDKRQRCALSLSDSVVTDLDVAVESESEGEGLVQDPIVSGGAGEPDIWGEVLERN